MAYYLLYYSLTFAFFGVFLALYLTRHYWTPYLPAPIFSFGEAIYTRLPSTPFRSSSGADDNDGSFGADIEGGFTSSDFDLAESNLATGDQRRGLDQVAKREVGRIMKRMRLGFDEARRVYMQRRFRDAAIGEDGRPRDPKFVSFS